jgi:hypothetical protein
MNEVRRADPAARHRRRARRDSANRWLRALRHAAPRLAFVPAWRTRVSSEARVFPVRCRLVRAIGRLRRLSLVAWCQGATRAAVSTAGVSGDP